MQLATIIFLVQYSVLGTALLMTYFVAVDFRNYRTWYFVRNGVCSTVVLWSIATLLFYVA